MRGRKINRYSVYERGTDRPIMIHGTADECAAALGVLRRTFYIYIIRQERGDRMNIEIFRDDPNDEEDLDG